jgi:hypothetical protein
MSRARSLAGAFGADGALNVADVAGLAAVASSGSYADLSGKPSLANVATSGSYEDLSNKPTLGSLAAKNTVAAGDVNSGVAVANIGYTPVNKAGDTVSGNLTVNGVTKTSGRLFVDTGMQFAGVMYLAGSGSGYDVSPQRGYRMQESYGCQFISSGSEGVWHHSLTNSSYIAGFGPSGSNYGSGNCYLTGSLSQNYSDIRLKNDLGTIENAVEKVMALRGFRYTINELGTSLGFNDDGVEAGLSAQDVQAVLPEAVMLAGSDMAPGENGENISKSGEYYLTLRYERVVPLLVNAIKEQQAQIEELKARVAELG